MFLDQSTDEFIRIKITEPLFTYGVTAYFKAYIKGKLETHKKDYYIDMSDVYLMDSTSIGMMLYLAKSLKIYGKMVHLENCQPNVKLMLIRLHFNSFLMVT